MTDSERTEMARRVRAARAYAGLSARELADAVGVGLQTIKRIEAGSREARNYELWAIADTCGLPRDWFEVDFAQLSQVAADASGVLARIDGRLARIDAQLGMQPRDPDVIGNSRPPERER